MNTHYHQDEHVTLYRANALNLPLADNSVDLVVTSPPYFGLRSYQDGGEHYEGQIGAEATPAEFVDALIAATREMMRVVKPSGSIWVNLGDKYSNGMRQHFTPAKSLMGIPWRYAIRCIDDLGLILRAEVIWSKPNGLPESVTDRVRRSHETWFHFTLSPRYYSAVDEVREEHAARTIEQSKIDARAGLVKKSQHRQPTVENRRERSVTPPPNPLGKLPGSVWSIATEPLRVPDHLGIDHFAAFPTEWPRRIITGWSPRGVCVECGAGRRPVSVALGESARDRMNANGHNGYTAPPGQQLRALDYKGGHATEPRAREITGEACDCPEPTAPTTPGVVLDPFSGTGTTALVASVLGRHGIGVDMSEDYCRLAKWRTTDPKQRAKAARKPWTPPAEQLPGQGVLDFGGVS